MITVLFTILHFFFSFFPRIYFGEVQLAGLGEGNVLGSVFRQNVTLDFEAKYVLTEAPEGAYYR